MLMWPWCLGVQGQGCQKSFWRVLEGLKPCKRQAWTPVTSFWCRVENEEKAVDVALVRWPAGSRVPKKPLEGFRGFGRFEAWQTAGLNASKKAIDVALKAKKEPGLNASNRLVMLPWRPRKSCWCGLGALGAGSGVPKKLLEGFRRFEAWQTAGLKRQ